MAHISLLDTFSLGADSVYLKSRPLPTAPDGRYDSKTSSGPGTAQEHSALTNVMHDVQSQFSKGPITADPTVVAGFLDTVINPDSVDDREGAFAAGLTLLSRLPPDSDIAKSMSDSAIGLLYNTIPHPVETLLTPVYMFREADGGNNNLLNPQIGRGGTPYARSVQGKWCYDTTALPDPELVFETLLKRRKITPHPNGNSSLTFAFATLVTHSLFRTDTKDWSINATSSYLDLSPLYGINQATQDQVRNKDLGRGLLYPDTFSEERLLFLPPATSVLLVILSRNHNYIAEKLLKINERGHWTDPPPEDPAARAKQDEEIFQTARLVNGGHFMSLIMGDYVAGFLGLSEGNAWNMNAFDPIKDKSGSPIKRGEGNHCSVEFNVLYRWHPTISQADEQWTNDLFGKMFDKPAETLTIADFGKAFVGTIGSINPDPSKREFAWLKRGPDGKFSDDDLAKVLHDATENVACSYGARGTPAALKVIEVMGIQQARQWGVCTMNEFRQWLGLKQFETFEEWNPDPAISGAARQLYKHIDNLELYTGLQCEAIMPLAGGLRFACGYTTTRAVLSDAIALIRGDRFYTTSFTPANLTNWGYQDCLRDANNGGLGGEMPKLLTRHLPRHYPYSSVYTCFPFFTPTKMKDSLTRQGKVDQYTFTRPVPAVPVKVLNTFTGINYVFNNPTQFPVVYDMKGLGNGYGFMLTFDQAAKHDTDKALVLHALFPDNNSLDTYAKWYKDGVTQRIANKSFTYDGVPGKYVDIVNDVINDAAIHWAADLLCGLDMKTEENPRGMYTEPEIYDMFTCLFQYTFLGIGDNEHGFSLRQKVLQTGGVLQAMVAKSIMNCAPKSAAGTNFLLGVISTVTSTVAGLLQGEDDRPHAPFLQRLAETGRPINELVANVIGLAIGSSVNYAQGGSPSGFSFAWPAVHVIDFYFDDQRAAERAQIVSLAKATDATSLGNLRGYVREAMRLNPQVTGLYRDVLADASIPQGNGLPNLDVKKGDRIFGSLKNAHLNATDFPSPTKVDPTRPASSYNYNGVGFHKCLGVAFAEQTITEIVRVVFRLKNVRRAPGNDGKLVGFTELQNETPTNVYLTDYGTTSPWPGSMILAYANQFATRAAGLYTRVSPHKIFVASVKTHI
ncbi:heme peroxidase [Marasmius fiardii PR-910]|nr:heme peroxidase [Marasmius fiardii PR-910]